MEEKEYRKIWNDTDKAINYLHNKGCMTLCSSVPSGYGIAHLLSYKVSDASDLAKKHVSKAYPQARIEYVDRDEVVYGELERQIAFANYRMSL